MNRSERRRQAKETRKRPEAQRNKAPAPSVNVAAVKAQLRQAASPKEIQQIIATLVAQGLPPQAGEELLSFVKRIEHASLLAYDNEHETPRYGPILGEASAPSHPLMEKQQIPLDHSAQAEGIQECDLGLGVRLPTAGAKGLTPQANPRPVFLSFCGAEGTLGPGITARSSGGRVPDRVVDLKAHRPGNLERISGALPPQCPVVPVTWDELELSEAPAALVSARRGGDCALAALSLAAYKKRPRSLARTWFSWTKAAFCSFLTLNAPGLPKDRRPLARCGTNKGGSMPSTPWLSRPSASGWHSTSSSTGAPSEERKWWNFSSSCSILCAAPWSCCGIAALFTAANWFRTSSSVAPGSIRNTFLLTPLNSTPRSMYGTVRMTPWLMEHPITNRNSRGAFALPCVN